MRAENWTMFAKLHLSDIVHFLRGIHFVDFYGNWYRTYTYVETYQSTFSIERLKLTNQLQVVTLFMTLLVFWRNFKGWEK